MEKAEMTLVSLDVQDVITTSGEFKNSFIFNGFWDHTSENGEVLAEYGDRTATFKTADMKEDGKFVYKTENLSSFLRQFIYGEDASSDLLDNATLLIDKNGKAIHSQTSTLNDLLYKDSDIGTWSNSSIAALFKDQVFEWVEGTDGEKGYFKATK